MRNFILLILFFASMQFASSQGRFVQIIHNSADSALTELDIYLNDSLIADNFQFRTATAFIEIPDTANFTNAKIYINPVEDTPDADIAIAENDEIYSWQMRSFTGTGDIEQSSSSSSGGLYGGSRTY